MDNTYSRDDFVWRNIDSGPLFYWPPFFTQEWQPTVVLPDGQAVPSAVPGQPETVSYWIRGTGTSYYEVDADQAFVHQLWMHFEHGAPGPLPESEFWAMTKLGLAREYSVSLDAMREAVLSLPHVLETITAGGYSEADVWAYTQHEAPWAVDLVGVAPA